MQINGSSNLNQYAFASNQIRQHKMAGEEELFAKADKNGDGKVDQSEMAAMLAQMASSQVQGGQNADGNGQQFRPSEEEIAAIFAEVDSDGDGQLSLEDFTAFGEKMRANGGQPSGAPPAGGPPPTGGPPPAEALSTEADEDEIASMFAAADTNGDGVVSMEELLAFLQKSGNNSGTDAAGSQSGLDGLKQMAQTTVDTLTNALSGDTNAASGKLSMADILAEMRKNGSENNEFMGFIQNIIEKAYLLGQRESSSGASVAGASAASQA